MLAAVEQMPDDWDETELGWYLVRRAARLVGHAFVRGRGKLALRRRRRE
jgi:hypothetical protein